MSRLLALPPSGVQFSRHGYERQVFELQRRLEAETDPDHIQEIQDQIKFKQDAIQEIGRKIVESRRKIDGSPPLEGGCRSF